jgi:hypothetical protein
VIHRLGTQDNNVLREKHPSTHVKSTELDIDITLDRLKWISTVLFADLCAERNTVFLHDIASATVAVVFLESVV